MDVDSIPEARRWAMLVVSLLAATAASSFTAGTAFLIPQLQDERGMSLTAAGTLVAMPSFGMMASLIAWGYVVDRTGERFVLTTGLGLTAVTAFLAAQSHSYALIGLFFFLAGAAAASANSASGRVVVGWFPPERRGMVMGIRQMAQPLGVALGALVIPPLARDHGVAPALLMPVIVCAVAAVLCATLITDPPRPTRAAATAQQLANPYRGSSMLARIHGVSVLLVVPQALVWTFTLVWLTSERGWSTAAAGTLIVVAQVLGALGRIVAGMWSDRLGSRLKPLRSIAVAAAVTMAALAVTDAADWSIAVVIMVWASVITVSDNGLAFTAIAEKSGPFWSGRALGTQNTAQYLASALVPPVFGAIAEHHSFVWAFAIAAVCPLVAAPLVPTDSPAVEEPAGT